MSLWTILVQNMWNLYINKLIDFRTHVITHVKHTLITKDDPPLTGILPTIQEDQEDTDAESSLDKHDFYGWFDEDGNIYLNICHWR